MHHAASPATAPRARRALTLLAAVAATGTLAACAPQASDQTNDLTGASGEVQDLIQKLSDRADAGSSGAICRDLLSPELVKSLGGAACADNLKKAIAASDYTLLNVDKVTINEAGTEAVALIKPVETTTSRRSISVARESTAKDAPWRVTALDPTGKTKAPVPSAAGTTPKPDNSKSTTPERDPS